MRVAVYSIALNEEANVTAWMESAVEADVILLVDTGSTDATFDLAYSLASDEYGEAFVRRISVQPWRFDIARNAALALVPDDVDYCIALDLDERLQPGWRKALDGVQEAGLTRPRYRYVWSWTEDRQPSLTYAGDKIHARAGYRWRHPVHEVLTPSGAEVSGFVDGLEIHHHPDPNKSRSSYLDLLELAIKEDPRDDRNAFYYARELMYAGRYDASYAAFHRHLELGKWAPERAASMRYLGLMCSYQRQPEAETWYLKACAEAPGYREPWYDLANFYVATERGALAAAVAKRALDITERQLEYLTEYEPWDGQSLEQIARGRSKPRIV